MPERSFKRPFYIALAFVLLVMFAAGSYSLVFGPAGRDTTKVEFIVTPDSSISEVADQLKSQNLIRARWAFKLAYVRYAGIHDVRPGGYTISSSMDTLSVAKKLAESPYLAWVSIPRGVRKEQIAEILARQLSWTRDQKEQWLAVDTNPSPSYVEGVYYPDTYLIPSDQTPAQVAKRMRDRFSEVFAPYAQEAAEKGIKWTTVLTMASLIEREAAGPDRALIAGILWNRMDQGMKLQVDATLQYIKGNEEDGWWGRVLSEDKYLDSPFNTYQHAGLPPHPIAEPSIEAVRAVLNPEETKCLFYLHDNEGQIYCSPTYKGHLTNIDKHLR